MGLINIDDIKPGMVLARSVTDQRGRVILAAGYEVSEKQLRILRMWGIVEADIQGIEKVDAAAQVLTELDPDVLKHAEESARKLLVLMDLNHPAVQELYRQCTLRLARRAALGGPHGA